MKYEKPVIYSLAAVAAIFALLFASALATPIQSGLKPESMHMKGKVDLYLYDKDGNLKDERHFDNLIVARGFECAADRLAGHSAIVCNALNYIAIGTGAVAPADGDTALGAENCAAPYARLQDTDATFTNGSPDSYLVSVSFNGAFSCAVTESGIFDALTTGNMQARQTFAVVNKGTSDTLTVNWTIQLT